MLLVGTWFIMLPIGGSALAALMGGNNSLPVNLFYSALVVLSVIALLRTTASHFARINAARRAQKNARR